VRSGEYGGAMKCAYRLLGALFGGISLICFWEAHRLWAGWASAGTFPVIIAVTFLIVSVSYILLSSRETLQLSWSRMHMYRILGAGGLFAFYIISLHWVGYIISTWFFTAAVTRYVSSTPLRAWALILWTGLLAIASYFVFIKYLSVYLPVGSLWG
jgi:hypothetical protein